MSERQITYGHGQDLKPTVAGMKQYGTHIPDSTQLCEWLVLQTHLQNQTVMTTLENVNSKSLIPKRRL